MHFRARILGAAALLACAPLHAADIRPDLAIEDVSIIDVENDRTLRHRTILVSQGRITAIAATGRIAIPATATRIDGRDRFLVPGLIDVHVHLFNNPSGRPPNDWALPLFVAHGVTGVREMSARPANVPVLAQWARDADAGTRVAPRVLGVAMAIGGEAPAAQVDAAAAAGATAIKLFSEFPDAQLATTLAAARAHRLPVVGHAPPARPLLDTAPDLGTNEHLMQAYEACSPVGNDILAERRAAPPASVGDVLAAQEPRVLAAFDARACRRAARALARLQARQVPTLVLDASPRDGRHATHPLWPLVRVDEQARWERNLAPFTDADRTLERQRGTVARRIVREFHAAGVPILAGTDAPMPEVYPGLSLHDELALLVQAGLPPRAALRAATIAAAGALDRAADHGFIAVGKRADLVLLDADPTRDIAHTRRIRGVVLDGRWLDRAALDRLLGSPTTSASTSCSSPSSPCRSGR